MIRNTKRTLATAAVATGLALAGSQAMASSVVLTFGTEVNQATIESYFNGGADSQGLTGPSDGVVFGANAVSLRAGFSGTGGTGTGKFENVPSGAPGVLFFGGVNNAKSTVPANVMDVSSGFTSLALNYSLLDNLSTFSGSVTLWSGLDGSGTDLGTFALGAASTTVACTNSHDEFCTWQQLNEANFGVAKSAVFAATSGPATGPEFDHVAIQAVPLPGALPLLLSGLGAFFGFVRRRGQ